MNKIMQWLNRVFSSCLGRRCTGHEPLKNCDLGTLVEMKHIAIIQNAPIFHLDDNCMHRIFAHLSMYDLASVSLTCRHFQDLATYHFSQQNKSKHLAFSDELVFGYDEVNADQRLSRSLDIMKAFGRLIDTIIVLDMIYFRLLPILQAEMNVQT